jgi:hypothetical protein
MWPDSVFTEDILYFYPSCKAEGTVEKGGVFFYVITSELPAKVLFW